MQFGRLDLLPPKIRLRIQQTQLAWELGWDFDYIESLPLYRFADLFAYKSGENRVK